MESGDSEGALGTGFRRTFGTGSGESSLPLFDAHTMTSILSRLEAAPTGFRVNFVGALSWRDYFNREGEISDGGIRE